MKLCNVCTVWHSYNAIVWNRNNYTLHLCNFQRHEIQCSRAMTAPLDSTYFSEGLPVNQQSVLERTQTLEVIHCLTKCQCLVSTLTYTCKIHQPVPLTTYTGAYATQTEHTHSIYSTDTHHTHSRQTDSSTRPAILYTVANYASVHTIEGSRANCIGHPDKPG